MYLKLHNQKEFIQKAICKAGSQRKLVKKTIIPLSSIARYLEAPYIPEKRFEAIVKFLGLENPEMLIKDKLESNFRQKLGGVKCVESKKKKGTFDRDMKNIQGKQSQKLKEWHAYMKKNKPKEYYLIQYSRFKKIGGYKYETKKGEKVRNLFEKQVADLLFDLKLDYEYEPLVNSGSRYFFPDFLINGKIILECTAWKGDAKAYKLKDKIENLKDKYEVYVVIPKHLYSYYKILNNHLILGLDECVSVAQTFCSVKTDEGEQ